jgi:hypothetical protein
VLASRRAIEALLHAVWNGEDDAYPEALDGWRRAAIGDDLWREARARRAAAPVPG